VATGGVCQNVPDFRDGVRLGVSTWTVPLVAPAGTVVVISDLETTVNSAAVLENDLLTGNPVGVHRMWHRRSLSVVCAARSNLPKRSARIATDGDHAE
jgi:hypothetical protein